jgi:anti-sigma factor ChrR (cupin superfamily)
MAKTGLNDDFNALVRVATTDIDWQESPSPSVWRKRLEHSGPAESGRVTSIVRYDADSTFPAHDHPDGEEILVLDGTFSDEQGDYPAGTFVLNPEGVSHAPHSNEGCVLFAKLRQYPGTDRRHVKIDTKAGEWNPGRYPGLSSMPLYSEDGHPESIRLVRFEPGAKVDFDDHTDGEEIFVIEGHLKDEHGSYPAGTWVRYPVGSNHAPWSDDGCILYVKSGHLPKP